MNEPIGIKLRVLEIHKPMNGEAYPTDPRQYCSVCVDKFGSAEVYPCRTLKATGFQLTRKARLERRKLLAHARQK